MKDLRMMSTLIQCLKCAKHPGEHDVCAHVILSATLPVLLSSLFTPDVAELQENKSHAQDHTA